MVGDAGGIERITVGEVRNLDVDLLIVDILALVHMHVAAHIESADLTGNTEDALIGDKQGRAVVVHGRMGRHAAHRDAIVLAKEAVVVDFVLHAIGRKAGELGSLLDVLGQRDDVRVGLAKIVDVQRESIHRSGKQGLGSVGDIVVSTKGDGRIQSAKDVRKQSVLKSIHSVVGQSRDGLPAIAADVDKGQTSFSFMFKQPVATPGLPFGLILSYEIRPYLHPVF